jgi:acetyl esterase/lipase
MWLLVLLAVAQVAQVRPTSRPMQQPLPTGTTVQRDVEYVEGGGKSRCLDLYAPDRSDGALPVVVWIHGGGWKTGGKEMGPAPMLVPHGYAVASINYRLSGEAPWPAQLDDCRAAIRWLRANAAKYNLDPNRIGVWGQSSGGHLAAMLGVTGDKDGRVQAVCDWSGPQDLVEMFDLKMRNPDGAMDQPVIELLGGPGVATKQKAAEASPITHVTKEAPPFLIMHGDNDRLVPLKQSELLDAALRKAGVECKFVVVPGAGHVFGGPDIFKQVAGFFDQRLRRPPGQAQAQATTAPAAAAPRETGGAASRPAGSLQWIDVHNHIYPDKNGDFSESVRVALALMDQAGISRKMLLPPPAGMRPDERFLKSCQEACKANRNRFAFGAASDLDSMMLNESNVTDALRRDFEKKAEEIVRQGASSFGEVFVMHLLPNGTCFGVAADHPLMLLLADVSARRQVPIDVHFDLITEDRPTPDHVAEKLVKDFPKLYRNNLPAFERLLAHNPKAKICWQHAGSDWYGYWTVDLSRRLLQKYPNLYMALGFGRRSVSENNPLNQDGQLRPEWLRLLQDFPDRFVIGSDSFIHADDQVSQRIPPTIFWTRNFLNTLPPELARKIASENAIALFKLKD